MNGQAVSMLNDDDLYLFGEGTQERAYQWMGAHARQRAGPMARCSYCGRPMQSAFLWWVISTTGMAATMVCVNTRHLESGNFLFPV